MLVSTAFAAGSMVGCVLVSFCLHELVSFVFLRVAQHVFFPLSLVGQLHSMRLRRVHTLTKSIPFSSM